MLRRPPHSPRWHTPENNLSLAPFITTMANAHAEVGLVQQAYDAGLTQGQSMTIVVRGEAVCTYCQQSTNLIAAANRAGLNSLQVVDTVTGRTYVWTRGSSGWK